MDRVTFRKNVFSWPYTAMRRVWKFYKRTGRDEMANLMEAEIERLLELERKLMNDYHADPEDT